MAIRNKAYRNNTLWFAAMVHRVSGVLLAIFLPFHFLVLGLALEGEASLDGFLAWTESPLVKLAETGLIFLLTIHLLGGIRVLVIENLSWREGHKALASSAAAVAAMTAFFFLARVF